MLGQPAVLIIKLPYFMKKNLNFLFIHTSDISIPILTTTASESFLLITSPNQPILFSFSNFAHKGCKS